MVSICSVETVKKIEFVSKRRENRGNQNGKKVFELRGREQEQKME